MFVVDIETTGLKGIQYGEKIVEVGVVEITSNGIKDRYSAIVKHDDIDLCSDAWVFNNTTLTVEDVKNGTPEYEVAYDLKTLLNNKPATSYNVPFDFGKFLYKIPWGVFPYIPFDIMILAHKYVDPVGYPASKWPPSEDVYHYLFPDTDPAGIGRKQTHRALDDARMEAYILVELLGLQEGE